MSSGYDIRQYEIPGIAWKGGILYLARMNASKDPRIPSGEEPQDMAAFIDHTLLHPTALEKDIRTLCEEAIAHGFKAVCIPGAFVPTAAQLLSDTGVHVATVIGFPLGTASTRAKCCEAEIAFQAGATELDMVLNPTWMRSGNLTEVAAELSEVRKAVPAACLKLILETCYLTDAQKRAACEIALEAQWDYVKTSTGFGSGGATLEDVRLMKEVVGERMGIKASGGIRDLDAALSFLSAGATRLGTSSGIAIVEAARHA